MQKDFSISPSSQVRVLFLLFLEKLLPQISKNYLKSTFLEVYLSFKNDSTMDLLLYFVRLAPDVRKKLDDSKSIEKLDNALLIINQRFMTDKKATDILNLIEDTLEKIRDPVFHQEI